MVVMSHMYLTNLKSLYVDMKNNKATFDIFEYTHRGVTLSIMFDIGCTPYKITIMKKRYDRFLFLDVENGFSIQTYLGEQLVILREMLEIPSGDRQFSPKEFFNKLHEHIPSSMSKAKISKQMLSKAYRLEDGNKTLFFKLYPWNPLVKKVSPENREKTRVLYPDLYEQIKDKNISVAYTDDPLLEHQISDLIL